MKTHSRRLQKGRLWRLAISLLLASAFAVSMSITAFAEGTATIWMAGGNDSEIDKGNWVGSFNTSTGSTVNLGIDEVYEASPYNFSGIGKVTMEANITNKSSIRVNVTSGLKNVSNTLGNSKWQLTMTAGANWNTLTYGDFNNLMRNITFNYSQETGLTEQSQVKVTVRLWYYSWDWRDSGWKQVSSDAWRFISTITFLDYANGGTAVSDDNPVTVSYKNGTDSNKVVEGAVDTNMGVAQVPWRFSTFGDAKKVSVGYQLRSATGTFSADTPVQGETTYDLSSMSNREKSELLSSIHTMQVEGFNADAQYYTRIAITTDGDTSNRNYSDEVAIRYDKPVISGFSMSNISKIYQGGDTTSVTMTGSFNNSNYNNITYCYDENENIVSDCTGSGSEHDEKHHTVTGPRLRAKIYFTSNYAEVVQEDGRVLLSGNTTWQELGSTSAKYINLQAGDEITSTFDASKATWDNVAVPEYDSRLCTFKAELTDMVTGYTVTKFFAASTDAEGNRVPATFTIDTALPHIPHVTANGVEDPGTASPLTVGGEGGSVALDISGGTDITNGMLGSGVAEYSYSMYYLSSDNVTAFMGEGATVQSTLEKLGELSATNTNANVEYTDWTSLKTEVVADPTVPTETATASLTVAQDGYYRLDVRTKDVAGHISDGVRTVYFRVDLTPPNTPEVFLAQGETASTLTAYDNRTYRDATVWMLVNSAPVTGKTIQTWEYSADGGLTWITIASTNGTSGVSAENLVQNTTGATVEVFEKSSYTAKKDFEYAYAVNLTGEKYEDYQTLIVRVTDTFGNVSQVSDPVIMRTIAAQPEGSLTLSHEGIEVALAMGNTQIKTSTLTADLKNAASDKINEKFYGNTGSTVETDPNFNPWLWVKSQTHTWNGKYQCHWTNDSSASGACHAGTACPYAQISAKGYPIYFPEQVNVQGISGANANDTSKFPWVRYDHTNYYFADHKVPAGTNYKERITYTMYTAAVTAARPTNLEGPDNRVGGGNLFYESNDRVIYSGQTTPGSITSETANGATTMTTSHNWISSTTVNGTTVTGDWSNNGAISAVWVKKVNNMTAGVMKRLYHVIDISYPEKDGGGTIYYDATSTTQGGDLSKIAFAGYQTDSFRDWLFLYNSQPTKKTIFFTTDDGNLFPHAHESYGFLFNTTIRQSKDLSWRISGYLFIVGNATQTENIGSFDWFMVRLDDINMENFADGKMTTSYSYDDLTLSLLSGVSQAGLSNKNGGDYGVQMIAHTEPKTASNGDGVQNPGTYNVNNFVLVIEGTETKLYNYMSYTKTAPGSGQLMDMEDLIAKFESDVTGENETGAGSYTAGYRIVNWTTIDSTAKISGSTTSLYTPRPKVDGVEIGSQAAKKEGIHTDTSCYGFGPIAGARNENHGCTRDSRIIVSNIYMRMDVAKTLAEVVSEPQWGDGKAKYIMNLSDDSSEDFNNPILSAQVQWRLFNDDAKYIGWGDQINQSITTDFLDRIDGTGMFEVHVSDTTTPTEIDTIATYITTQYYSELGYDVADGPVVGQIEGNVSSEQMAAGVSFDLDDMENFTLRVSSFDESSANPDFPEGRWWIIHDVEGFPAAQKSARSDSWSDALELTITEAGRWTVYFAPDRGSDGYPINLDPQDAVFNFTVNETPVAQFTGTMSGNNISINDQAYDPETLVAGQGYQNGKGYTKDGSEIQLTGIVNRWWRWEILSSKEVDGVQQLTTLASGAWSKETTPLGGKNTVQALTMGALTDEGKAHAEHKVSGNSYYFQSIPTGSVLTVYEYVEDVSTYVTGYEMDANGAVYTVTNADGTKSIGKTYYANTATRTNTASSICQQNITEGISQTVYAPQAAFSLDNVNIYHTANANSVVTVTRESMQTQGNATFEESWAIDLNDGNGYRLLGKVGESWYLYPEANYYVGNNTSGTFMTEAEQKETLGAVTASSDRLVLTIGKDEYGNDITPAQTNGFGSGFWTMKKSFIESKAKDTGKLILRITETIEVKDEDGNVINTVSDQSARAIYYKTDTNPPTAQTVSGKIYTENDGGGYTESNYAAGSYLDVSNNRAYIELSVGGSIEREGVLSGYDYYFYKTTGTGSSATTVYYEHDNTSGELGDEPVSLSTATKSLSATGGKILINRKSMTKTPLDSISVAIYAYDNAGNKTTPTKYENIKLSVSEPAAPAIMVKDALGEVVNSIPNNLVFYKANEDSTNGTPIYNADGTVTGPDSMSVPGSQAYTNSNVTVQFTPKSGNYTLDSTTGDYGPATTGGTTMFTDAFNKADLTNTALIVYSVLVRTDDTSAYGYNELESGYAYYGAIEDVTDSDGNVSQQMVYWKNREISSSRTLTLTEDNTYRIVAQVRNGAGTISRSQMVQFTIDKQAPDAIPTISLVNVDSTTDDDKDYLGTEWSTGVQIVASGSDDTNATSAYYEYSIDNGATWIRPTDAYGNVSVGLSNPLDITFDSTGEYTVMIRATDQAGNSSPVVTRVVKIDKDPPVMSAPTLSASSKSVTIYEEYITTVEHSPAGGEVYTQYETDSGDLDYTNLGSEFVCAREGSLTFKIVPEDGHDIETVTFGGVNMIGTEHLAMDDDGAYILVTPPLTADVVLKVVFRSTDSGDQATYAIVETTSQTESAIEAAVLSLAEDAAASAEEGTDNTTTDDTTTDDTTTDDTTTDDTTDDTTTDDTTGGDGTTDDTTTGGDGGTTGEGEGEGDGEGDGDTDVTGGPYTVDVVRQIGGEITGTIGEETVSGELSGAEIAHGAQISLTVTPSRGYELEKLNISANGIVSTVEPSALSYDPETDAYSYTGATVTSNLTIYASFTRLDTRRVSISPAVGGSVSLAGKALAVNMVDGYYQAYKGKQLYVVVTPTSGYQIESLKIAGELIELEYPIITEDDYTYVYTVPTDESTDVIKIETSYSLRDQTNAAKITLGVIGGADLGSFEGITLDEEGWGTLEIPAKSSYTIKITPKDHYKLEKAFYTYEDPYTGVIVDGEGSDVTLNVQELTNPDGSIYYQYTFRSVTGTDNMFTVQFRIETFAVTLGSNAGGVLNISGYTGSRSAIPWGTEVTAYVTTEADYRIGNMILNGTDLGAVRTHTFTVTENTSVSAEFVKRDVNSTQMVHTIDVIANNISDKEDALAQVPYRFRVKKATDTEYSTWSEWQVGNTISFTDLDANSAYTVEVQAKDVVGNFDSSFSTIYTLANSPDPLSLDSKNEENTFTKSAVMAVDPMGNPENTEYRVYYSGSQNMTNMQIANYDAEDPEKDGWEELVYNADTDQYEFVVSGLGAGQRYYMQVVARNRDGVETALTGKILDVMLSHASPPENTLYFAEQAGPNGGVTLGWVDIPVGVEVIELYRDSVLIARVSTATTTYTDNSDIPADKLCTYSYAYTNEAGAGSRRTAVSEEYFLSLPRNDTSIAAANKLSGMDELVTRNDTLENEDTETADKNLFTQTLTYPAYPESITGTAQARGNTVNSGEINVTVNYNTSTINRPQSYTLGLRAYDAGTDNLVDGWEEIQDQYLVETDISSSAGAIASWTGLNVNYEYYVYIDEIRTTGPQYIPDEEGKSQLTAYFGNSTGVEGYLGKQYVVNGDGYYSTYYFEDIQANLYEDLKIESDVPFKLNTVKQTWASDEEKLEFTNGLGWGVNFSQRLKFNKSPEIALADSDPYADSTNIVTNTEGDDYILIDQHGDSNFKLNVAAWDPDGTANDQTATATIRAQVGNVTSATLSGIVNDDLPETEEEAQADPFVLDLGISSSTSTNFYESLTLSVSDGEISFYNRDEKIDLVVNQTKPTIKTTVIGSESGVSEHKIEHGKTYTTSLVSINTSLPGNESSKENLRPVRLLVMSDKYDELFGSHVLETIATKLQTDATAIANARELLGDTFDTYTDSIELAKAAVDAVAPDYKAYVQITDQTVIDDPTHKDNLVVETTGNYTRYWAEVSYALDKGICTWFTGSKETGYTVTGAVGTKHALRIEANFGRNVNTSMLYFECVSPASLKVESNPVWEWVEADQPEYVYYSTKGAGEGATTGGFSIQEIYEQTVERYKGLDFDCPEIPANIDTAADAFKIEGDKMYVYKLNNTMLEVFNHEISGWVNVTTGVHKKFTQAYVLVTVDPTYKPTADDVDNPGDLDGFQQIFDPETGSQELTGQGTRYHFEITKLKDSTTYYIYTAYRYSDPTNNNATVTVVNTDDTVVITTNVAYSVSKYAFNRLTASYDENSKNFAASENTGWGRSVNVVRSGDINETAAVLKFTAEFYEANQFGQILEDETTGEEKKLAEPYLSEAKKVFSFESDPAKKGDTETTMEFLEGTPSNEQLRFYLWKNGEIQKHMVVRVTMEVESQSVPYNRIQESAGVVDIFILDAESKVTEYRVGVDNTPDAEGKSLDLIPAAGTVPAYYEYEFEGLQVDYASNETRTITLINASDPEGALTGIKVNIYKERDKTSGYSDDFQLVWGPNETLGATETWPYDSTNFQVTAKHGLEDNVYEAWINVTADHVLEENELWIKIRQVVGQSTLYGRVYFTQTSPGDNVRTGVSTVSLYAHDQANSTDDGKITGELLYQTQTSEMGGYFEIPNIINGQKYWLVVEREGYIPYDSIYINRIDQTDKTFYFETLETSQHFELNLQLRGGDIDGDADIDMDDYSILNDCFNNYYGGDAPDSWDLSAAEKEALLKKCRASDFNADGIVNVFDRIIFWDSYALRYGDSYNQVDQTKLLRTGAYDYRGLDMPKLVTQTTTE